MSNKEITDAERELLAEMSDEVRENLEAELTDFMDPSAGTTPLHILLYGRRIHRVDSYSVVDPGKRYSQSHIYLTDAASNEEAQAMFAQNSRSPGGQEFGLEASGSIAIWQPKAELRGEEVSEYSNAGIASDSEMVAGAKIYVPNHVTDVLDSGLKGVFLVPTVMERIYMQVGQNGSIRLCSEFVQRS